MATVIMVSLCLPVFAALKAELDHPERIAPAPEQRNLYPSALTQCLFQQLSATPSARCQRSHMACSSRLTSLFQALAAVERQNAKILQLQGEVEQLKSALARSGGSTGATSSSPAATNTNSGLNISSPSGSSPGSPPVTITTPSSDMQATNTSASVYAVSAPASMMDAQPPAVVARQTEAITAARPRDVAACCSRFEQQPRGADSANQPNSTAVHTI